MNGEKVTTCDDKLVFKNSGKNFTLKGEDLKMISDYKFITTDSWDAKLIIDSLDEIRFDIHALGESLREKNFRKNYFNKRALLVSGLRRSERTNFFFEFCDKLCLIIQEKQAGRDANRFDNENVAIMDK